MITAEELLQKQPTASEIAKLEAFKGGFESTTLFLTTIKMALLELEAFPEAKALGEFIPAFAQVEADVMNGNPSPNETKTLEVLKKLFDSETRYFVKQ